MAVSLGYVAKEATSNLWRNRLMTVAAVLTAAVSLALVGSTLLLKQGMSHATVTWQQGVNVIVFVKPGVSTAQFDLVGSQLHQLPFVESCTPRSQQWDYEEAKRITAQELSSVLTPAIVPSSWRCQLNNPSQASAIKQQFAGKPNIAQVSSPDAQIRTMENVIHILQWVFLAIAVVLLLSAAVLILNTIRVAIFARRREVSVMKLVGATNWFIRLPFMAEGLVQGFLGAVVAVMAVVGLYFALGLNTVKTAANMNTLKAEMAMSGWELAITCVVVAVVGTAVGVIGSAFAVRRFLDV